MKLMSYNIRYGAATTLPDVIQVIASAGPDILVVNEANRFSDQALRDHFASQTGLSHSALALSAGKHEFHTAIFSKFPFASQQSVAPMARACAIVVLDCHLGRVAVGGLHLDPRSEALRVAEIRLVLDEIKDHEKTILMGDFNSLSPRDGYPAQIAGSFNAAQNAKFTINGELCFDTISAVLATGMLDVAQEMGKQQEPTVPTASNSDSAHANLRLDYIFISPSLVPNLHSYCRVKSQDAETASDHYPVTAELG
jgi:endonuclease/exonuclease/phosphatase family metal-dependent hydrolase